MKHLLITVAAAALFAISAVGAFAAPNPSGQGLPSQTCTSGMAPLEPGNAASNNGSPFNENLPGKAGTVYSATSQYDVACYQVSQLH
jgi:hypothetical protein